MRVAIRQVFSKGWLSLGLISNGTGTIATRDSFNTASGTDNSTGDLYTYTLQLICQMQILQVCRYAKVQEDMGLVKQELQQLIG